MDLSPFANAQNCASGDNLRYDLGGPANRILYMDGGLPTEALAKVGASGTLFLSPLFLPGHPTGFFDYFVTDVRMVTDIRTLKIGGVP